MKTKELVKFLNELDPNGDCEVCIENADIERLDILPAYYDGRIKVITERDEHFWPTKTKVTGAGTKINLYRHDWQDMFRTMLYEQGEEYIVDHGEGAAGQKGYNWLDADVIASKFKLTIIAENDIEWYCDDPKRKHIKEERLNLCKFLRTKYIDYISEYLNEYIKTSGHFKSKKIQNTALTLVKKCKEVEFPLEVFRHGEDYVINRNANWMGYEFRIDKDGKFYVQDRINNRKLEKTEFGHKDITPFIEENIETYDFQKIVDAYIQVMKKSDY